jgi:predicted negative regulator of RcsB-dependent stress response
MPQRRSKTYRNSLRPWLVANGMIAGVILAFLGMVYGWLGWKKKERGEQIRTTREAIEQLGRQKQAQQVRMNARLTPNELQQRVDGMALGLIPITDAVKQEVPASSLAEFRKQHESQSPH